MTNDNPPVFFELIMKFLLGKEENSHRLGDLQEVFREIQNTDSRGRALIWYCRQILKALPRIAWSFITWKSTMLKNYFKVTLRNLVRYKAYSIINIAGLSLGLSCCLFLLLWVQYQVSFDRFHENAEQLFRVEVDIPQPQGTIYGPNTPYPLGPAIRQTIPEIKNLIRWQWAPTLIISRGEKKFYERAMAVIGTFLKCFPFLYWPEMKAKCLTSPIQSFCQRRWPRSILKTTTLWERPCSSITNIPSW